MDMQTCTHSHTHADTDHTTLYTDMHTRVQTQVSRWMTGKQKHRCIDTDTHTVWSVVIHLGR